MRRKATKASQDTPSVTRSSAHRRSQFESHFRHDGAYPSYVVFASNPSRRGNRVRRLRRHVGANARYCTLEFVLAVSVTQQTERVCGNATTTTGVRATRQAAAWKLIIVGCDNPERRKHPRDSQLSTRLATRAVSVLRTRKPAAFWMINLVVASTRHHPEHGLSVDRNISSR